VEKIFDMINVLDDIFYNKKTLFVSL